MNITIAQISRSEVLRYLGYKPGIELEASLSCKIDEGIAEMLALASPRFTARRFPLLFGETVCLSGTSFVLPGRDIRRHLEGCHSAILLAVTLSGEPERKIRLCQLTDMTRALILDACAADAVEQACDLVQAQLAEACAKDGDYLTARFSPGYGDLSLGLQRELLRLLDTPRAIGLSVTGTDILTPKKSVTAVIGVSSQPHAPHKKDCKTCNLYQTCAFRRDGITCATK